MSGRKYATIAIISTYCVVILLSTVAMVMKTLSVETAVALIGAFAVIARETAGDYFRKNNGKPS